jgi:Periplasmic binding protein
VTKLGGFAYGISPSATNAIKGTFASSAPSGVSQCYADYSVPFGTVDFTAQALALKSASCNGAVTAFVDSSDLAFATSVRQSNNPVKILNYTGYDQQTLSTAATRAAYNGVYFSNQIFFDKSNPAVAQMYTNMEKYIPHFNPNTIPDFGLFGGYLTADLMIKGLEVAGANPTRQSFITNLRQVTGYTAGGLLPSPTPFAPFGTPQMLPETYCTYYIQLQGDNFVSVGPGGNAICGTKVSFKGFGQ